MLEIKKSINMVGNSKINDVIVKVFDARINEDDPENIIMNSYIQNYDLYKANRTAIMAEQTEFENAVYAIQESLLTTGA